MVLACLLQVYKKGRKLRDWRMAIMVATNYKAKPLRQGAFCLPDFRLLKGTCKLSFTVGKAMLTGLQFCLSVSYDVVTFCDHIVFFSNIFIMVNFHIANLAKPPNVAM
jgi:hypothetical protein